MKSRTALLAVALASMIVAGISAQRGRGGAPSMPTAPTPPGPPRVEELKREAAADVESMRVMTQQMVDQVFSFAELGFQEFDTSNYLTGILEKNGFKLERGYAGIPTAWTATWGSGKPAIAIGSDIDDIPQASQKPGVAYKDPIIEGAPGHGEGHNSGVPLNITAALAVKKIMEREHLAGTLKLWPGVAEELVGAKMYFIRAGMFRDVDVSLFAHVGSSLGVSWGAGFGTGLQSIEYTFKGESAHAAAQPWRGRSALDAVELMDVAWNFRREHLRLQQRSHYVIPNGGDQPNVVPQNASVWYYFREIDYPHIKELREIGDKIARAAAMMTDTDVTSRILGAAWPQHMNKTVAETMYANIVTVGLPKWDEADVTLAKGIQRELKQPQIGGRAVRRHRRRLVERADRHAQLSREHSGNARPQLGERHRDGDAARAQGRHRRREGAGDDDHRSADAARARPAGVGVLPERADEGSEVRAVHHRQGSAGAVAQSEDRRSVSERDEEVLLRSDEVQNVSRAAGDQVSDGQVGPAGRVRRVGQVRAQRAGTSSGDGTNPYRWRPTIS